MKKFILFVGGMVLFGLNVSGAPADPMWMFTEATDEKTLIYACFRICDTVRSGDYICLALESDQLPDTGDSYNGSVYINFDYKFNSDPIVVRDEFDTSIILYSDSPRPGYAGFKTAWDYGMTGFPISRYKYLVFAHKGPNPNHRVTVKCWYNSGQCGAPSFNEYLGQFDGSTEWKLDTIEIPEEIRNKPDKERNTSKYYELVFIINNKDPNDTTSGPPGNLKIDEMRLVGCNPIDTSPVPQNVNEGEKAVFRVVTSTSKKTDKLTYQWKKDGEPIAGATDSVYAVASVTQEHVGVYTVDVTVSGTGLTFTSLEAPLTIGAGVVNKPQRIDNIGKISPEDRSNCGCGSGTGLALLPPIWFKINAYRRRKKSVKNN